MAETVKGFEIDHQTNTDRNPAIEGYGPLRSAGEIDRRRVCRGVELTNYGVNVGIRASTDVDFIDFCVQDSVELSQTLQRYRLHDLGATEDGGKMFGGVIPQVRAGTVYGFRASGPNEFPYKLYDYDTLLLDPYAKQTVFHRRRTGNIYEPFEERPYSVIADTSFNWRGDKKPDIDPERRVIYEVHLKGATKLHPDVPEKLRGTYAGLAHPAVIRHLQETGVTSLELLPVQQAVSESLTQNGRLPNYWGYNTIGFFAPAVEYAADKQDPNGEFKKMVKALHRAGIEVILDVVYNHTGEGGHGGPKYLFKGLDNGMYRMDQYGNYVDFTGCGNTLDVSRPAALKVVMDSLRYWTDEMHVDGYRFDLASALVRGPYGNIDLGGKFMSGISCDRTLRSKVLIAEPWDATGGAYLVNQFKHQPGWQAWNGEFRDKVRSFWNHLGADINDMSDMLTGSKKRDGVVNFLTSHDGFTLRDLVSYNTKHNLANNENNRDGENHNNSNNHGYEGATDNPSIREARIRTVSNMLGTLAMSDGVPMLLGGDELGRTQHGNNNAYCQDNELSWLHWELETEGKAAFAAVQAWFRVRRENDRAGELEWLGTWGEPMKEHDWHNGWNALGMFRGARRVGRDLLYLVNGMNKVIDISLPKERRFAGKYAQLINTGTHEITVSRPKIVANSFQMAPLSSMVLRRV